MIRASFTTGSTLGHVLRMSSATCFGLLALFSVELMDMFWISQLENVALVAAIGFSSALMFLVRAICTAFAVSASALVSQALGAERPRRAHNFIHSTWFWSAIASGCIATALWFLAPTALSLLGANGLALEHAVIYFRINLLFLPILSLAVVSSAALRAYGKARVSLACELLGAGANALLDPLLIFGFGLELVGAAIATVSSQTLALLALVNVLHRLKKVLAAPFWPRIWNDRKVITRIATPTLATQLTAPIGGLYVMASVAQFGQGYAAGFAVVLRLIPVTQVLVFGFAGAIGPLIAQNYGAQNWPRVWRVISDTLAVLVVYTFVVSAALMLGTNWLLTIFSLGPEGSSIIKLYTYYMSWSCIPFGLFFLFVTVFNNTGRPVYSTVLTVLRATVGTIPLVWLGTKFWGPQGAVVGNVTGAFLSGLAAWWWVRKELPRP